MTVNMTLEKKCQDNGDVPLEHIPVLLNEVIEYLHPQEKDIFVDGTLGLGGHAIEVLKKIGPLGRLVGIDRDEYALKIVKQKLSFFVEQCHFVHEDYRNIDKVLNRLEIQNVDGILLDVGVSSLQMDDPDRGFSLKSDAPLDMRMDQDNPITAYDLINSLSEKEIEQILRDFGEERYYRRIAHRIVAERQKSQIKTTQELRNVVMRAMPFNKKYQKIHPATRTFQAFRIAVNRELESLQVALDKCVNSLSIGGRLGVISFHSLEDRIVKHRFRELAKEEKVKLLVKKPIRPSDDEIKNNPRSRSAKFRIIERI